jgi:hypothetical protein
MLTHADVCCSARTAPSGASLEAPGRDSRAAELPDLRGAGGHALRGGGGGHAVRGGGGGHALGVGGGKTERGSSSRACRYLNRALMEP